ncbi:MAG: hypothetical protein QXU81_00050 [Candidatus Bathyarchaeia archaeon]
MSTFKYNVLLVCPDCFKKYVLDYVGLMLERKKALPDIWIGHRILLLRPYSTRYE